MKSKEKHNKKLLVEGKDDQHVNWALCERFSILENFDIIDCEGIDKLLEQIPLRFKMSGVTTVGIVLDADSDINRRWMTLRSVLVNLDFDVPESLSSNGLFLNNSSGKRVGVWIMPNNSANGMLEDFISFLIPEDDPALPRVKELVDDIIKNGENKFSDFHKSKVLIHTWLALQEDPGTPMGLAITKKYLTTDENTCAIYINWLRALFS